ncbi:hypothetical protein F2Q69_00022037 [Brassica cretica]|uniref:Uncharacterized protein n=1 Tax=Brassica cretica TaxID=69181 RepID=A0A8S9Q0N4_BRACR|nr:hypothetical protein F2Q69_00022037 [Brassica cretica]
MSQEQMNFMRVSHMRNFLTCKDVMKQINTKQKPVGKEQVSAILAREDPDGYPRAIDEHALQVSERTLQTFFRWLMEQKISSCNNATVQRISRRYDQGHPRDVDEHIIRVSKDHIRRLLERASRDEHNYICLPEHASSFTQTKVVPEIYTKDEIIEMF